MEMSKNPKNGELVNVFLLKVMRNFSDVFGENVAYDNIKSHKKTGFHPLSRKKHFWKNHRGGGKLTRQPFWGNACKSLTIFAKKAQ